MNDLSLPLRMLEYNRIVINRFGQPITYLLGGSRTPIGSWRDAENSRNELLAMLQSLLNYMPDEYYGRIARCPGLGVPTASIHYFYRPNEGEGIFSTLLGRNTLFVAKEFMPESGDALTHLSNMIWNECGDEVLLCNFSRDKDSLTYRNFNSEERESICKARDFEFSFEL